MAGDEPRWMICEGRCNPGIYDHDALVKRYIRSAGARTELLEVAIDMSRRFRHTLHAPHTPTMKGVRLIPRWRCLECDHVRQ